MSRTSFGYHVGGRHRDQAGKRWRGGISEVHGMFMPDIYNRASVGDGVSQVDGLPPSLLDVKKT